MKTSAENNAARSGAGLTAYRITLSDNTIYVTSMAAGITLADAEAYFLHQTFTHEDNDGHETSRTVTKVEPVTDPLE